MTPLRSWQVNNNMRRISVALFYTGFGSILSQILLVREFLVSFYGNELSIGIIFACWLIWIGLGGAFGNIVVKHRQDVSRLFLVLIALTPLVTFVQILIVKFVRVFFHTASGEFLSMLDLLEFSCVVLSVGCFLWGLLFTLGAKSMMVERDKLWFGVNRAYILESLGSVVGGLLFSFFFASLYSTLQIVFLIMVIAWCMVLGMVFSEKKLSMTLSFTGLVIMGAMVFQPIRSFEYKMNAYQWRFINDKLLFIGSIDTKYQNLSLLSLENQYTVYTNGRPAFTIPNTYDAELFTHSIMIHRPDAKRVLVLGGGFNGVLREVLKYTVQDVEYVEIDPALLSFVGSAVTIQDQQAMHDSRVNIVFMDGRKFLHGNMPAFDVILMNIGEPSTASLNRFYTVEFFQQCYHSLNNNGIFAFSFPSSTEYIADELKDLDASIYQTFKHIFTNTLIVPGTHAVLIGTKSTTPLISQPDSLASRYAAAGISAEYFSKYTFEELMPLDQIKSITNTLETAKHIRINTDNNPVTYYFDLLLWNKFLEENNTFLSSITRSRIFITGGVGDLFLLLLLLLRWRHPERQKQIALTAIMAIGGMIGMALNLLFLLNFQETFGSIYEMVGAMIAANMLGLALGTLIAPQLTKKFGPKTILFAAWIALAGIVILLPQLLNSLLRVQQVPVTLIMTLFSGGLIGILFGIVNRLYLRIAFDIGSVYAFDIFGSSVGALITCSVLLPVLGIQETAAFLTLNLCTALIALGFVSKTS